MIIGRKRVISRWNEEKLTRRDDDASTENVCVCDDFTGISLKMRTILNGIFYNRSIVYMSLTKDLIFLVEVRKKSRAKQKRWRGKKHHLIRILEYKKIAFKVKNILNTDSNKVFLASRDIQMIPFYFMKKRPNWSNCFCFVEIEIVFYF